MNTPSDTRLEPDFLPCCEQNSHFIQNMGNSHRGYVLIMCCRVCNTEVVAIDEGYGAFDNIKKAWNEEINSRTPSPAKVMSEEILKESAAQVLDEINRLMITIPNANSRQIELIINLAKAYKGENQ